MGFHYLRYPGTYEFDPGDNTETCSKVILSNNNQKWSIRNCDYYSLFAEVIDSEFMVETGVLLNLELPVQISEAKTEGGRKDTRENAKNEANLRLVETGEAWSLAGTTLCFV